MNDSVFEFILKSEIAKIFIISSIFRKVEMNSLKVSANVIDEMFPDGSGAMMMDLDEV